MPFQKKRNNFNYDIKISISNFFSLVELNMWDKFLLNIYYILDKLIKGLRWKHIINLSHHD